MILDGSLRHDAELPWWNQSNLCKSDIERFWGKVMVPYYDDGTIDYDSCWMFDSCKDKGGYHQFWIKPNNCRAHRIMFECCNGLIKPGMNICHKYDNVGCVNPLHLFEGTTADNIADKISKGRHITGVNVHTSKLSEDDIFMILEGGYTGKFKSISQISDVFNISIPSVYQILAGNSWKETVNSVCLQLGYTLSEIRNNLMTKTPVEIVIEIRVKHSLGHSGLSLSREFNLGETTVYGIINRKRYINIPNEQKRTEEMIALLTK